MPKKIRDLVRSLEKAGFEMRSGKGSHRKFFHNRLHVPVVLSGRLSDDAKQYQEKLVLKVLEDLEDVED